MQLKSGLLIVGKKDIKKIEKVQRRATNLIPHLKNLSYPERLYHLKLTTLEDRRHIGDLIQFFKFYFGFNILNFQKEPEKSNGTIRGLRTSQHSLARPDIPTCSQREHFFINRVIPRWNALPKKVVEATFINQFKNRYDRHYALLHPSYNSEARRLRLIQLDS